MSPRSSRAARVKQSAAPDVYVGLLFLSVAALITGIVFLVMELRRYDWQRPAGGAGSTAPATAPANP
ncbi:MAG: hypothetical protein WD069_03150 [Planctomycetales bacterium]